MNNKLSIKLNELAKEKNVNQTQIAKSIGVSVAAISYWLSGKKEATADNIVALADYFEVSTDYLLGRSNDIGLIEVQNELTKEETTMLSLFRKLPPKEQYRAIGIIQALAS